jgi:hypothetical protein
VQHLNAWPYSPAATEGFRSAVYVAGSAVSMQPAHPACPGAHCKCDNRVKLEPLAQQPSQRSANGPAIQFNARGPTTEKYVLCLCKLDQPHDVGN